MGTITCQANRKDTYHIQPETADRNIAPEKVRNGNMNL